MLSIFNGTGRRNGRLQDVKNDVNTSLPPRGFFMDGSSGFGPPTRPPSHHDRVMTVVLRAFVPFTAAGQRGHLTPLPHIHAFFYNFFNFRSPNRDGDACQERNACLRLPPSSSPAGKSYEEKNNSGDEECGHHEGVDPPDILLFQAPDRIAHGRPEGGLTEIVIKSA